MTRCEFRPQCAPPGRRQPRLEHCAGVLRPSSMAPAPNPGPSATVVARGIAAIGIWRLLAVAMPHLAALVIMVRTETDLGSRGGFVLSSGTLNFAFTPP